MKRKIKRRTFTVSGGRVGGGNFPKTKQGRPGINQGRPKARNPLDILKFENFDDIAKGINDAKEAAETLKKLHDDYVKPLKTGLKTNVKVGISMGQKPSEHTGGEEPTSPVMVQNTEQKHTLANISDDRVVHKTVYTTGVPTSSALKALKKQNGSGYRVLTDSLVDVSDLIDRNILTQRCGFNQKLYHVPPIRSQVPLYLIKDLIANDKAPAPDSYAARRVLSNVFNVKQQFMIKNTSAHFPMIFTIHLVKIKNTDYITQSMNSLMNVSFYGTSDDLNDYNALSLGFAPKYLQHRPLQIEGSGTMQSSYVLVSNKLKSPASSSNFRSAAKIVESFQKTIPPGDFWNFSHIHNCGAGIDFTSIYRATDEGSGEETDMSAALTTNTDQKYMPFTYGVIFECKGKTAEAYFIPAENSTNTYIGSAPCNYTYEFKTSAYFAAEEIDGTSVNTPGLRIWEQDYAMSNFGTVDPTREKFILPTDLSGSVLAATAGNVGKGYIPMLTSAATSAALFEGVNDPG